MIRRDFLRQLTRTAAGLYLAPDALELLAEPRRRYWPGAEFGTGSDNPFTTVAELDAILKEYYYHSVITNVRRQGALLRGIRYPTKPIEGRRFIVEVNHG